MCDNDLDGGSVEENPDPEADTAPTDDGVENALDALELVLSDDVEADIVAAADNHQVEIACSCVEFAGGAGLVEASGNEDACGKQGVCIGNGSVGLLTDNTQYGYGDYSGDIALFGNAQESEEYACRLGVQLCSGEDGSPEDELIACASAAVEVLENHEPECDQTQVNDLNSLDSENGSVSSDMIDGAVSNSLLGNDLPAPENLHVEQHEAAVAGEWMPIVNGVESSCDKEIEAKDFNECDKLSQKCIDNSAVQEDVAILEAGYDKVSSNSVLEDSEEIKDNSNLTDQEISYESECVCLKSSVDGDALQVRLNNIKVCDSEVAGISDSDHSLHQQSCLSPNGEEDQLLSELEAELQTGLAAVLPVNGLTAVDVSKFSKAVELKKHLEKMKAELMEKDSQLTQLKSLKKKQTEQFEIVVAERDSYLRELRANKECDLYLPQIKELEYTVAGQQTEIKALKEKLCSHDSAAKRALLALQSEMKSRVDQATKMYEECAREKDSMVVKFAQAEQKGLDAQRTVDQMVARLREGGKEREMLTNRLKNAKVEYNKLAATLESKNAEVAGSQEELEKQKELVSSGELRLKWAQNKLKVEIDGHKDTKSKLEKVSAKLNESREETEQIRRDCQAMIKTYQESEEIKSNTLDQQLKEKEHELLQNRQETSDNKEIYKLAVRELETLKGKHKDVLEELKTMKVKVKCLESERLKNEETLAKFKEIIQNQKRLNKDLQGRIEELLNMEKEFNNTRQTVEDLKRETAGLALQNEDLQSEVSSCRKHESELLELTEKLSGKNACLQSENSCVNNKVLVLDGEVQRQHTGIQELEIRCKELSDSLSVEKNLREDERASLAAKLETKTKAVEELSIHLEEERDEVRTLKRKHNNNLKDLTRQLFQARRRLDSLEKYGEKDSQSLGSRTSSTGSLNTLDSNMQVPVSSVTSLTNARNGGNDQHEYPVITEQVEVDKQVLIERIVKLQKAQARKSEKIEFMEDHISHLVDEIQRKKRIIQSYVMREEAGALVPEYMDQNKLTTRRDLKAVLSRKGGIMASLYSSHAADQTMTLDLSLQINRKLQSVLEDTLLKNITLKENLDTLGQEIARLSQENRKLQLQLQGKK